MGQVAEGQVQNLSWLFIAALTNAIFSADIHCPCFEQTVCKGRESSNRNHCIILWILYGIQ